MELLRLDNVVPDSVAMDGMINNSELDDRFLCLI